MIKIRRLSAALTLWFTLQQLRFLYRHILRCRRYYYYHLTDVFWHISRLSKRQELLEHQLNALMEGDR